MTVGRPRDSRQEQAELTELEQDERGDDPERTVEAAMERAWDEPGAAGDSERQRGG